MLPDIKGNNQTGVQFWGRMLNTHMTDYRNHRKLAKIKIICKNNISLKSQQNGSP